LEALSDQTKREVLAELIRPARFIEYPEVSEDELLLAADDFPRLRSPGSGRVKYPARGEVWLVDLAWRPRFGRAW